MHLSSLKSHFWVDSREMWKVMLKWVVLALGLATKTPKKGIFRFEWATKSTLG